MQSYLQSKGKHLPSVNSKQPIASVFQTLKNKKAQFSKQLQELDTKEIALPSIPFEKPEKEKEKETVDNQQNTKTQNNALKQSQSEWRSTPLNKYKIILDHMEMMQKSKITNKEQHNELKVKHENKQQKIVPTKSNDRAKTQTKAKQQKQQSKYTGFTKVPSIQKSKAGQEKVFQYDESIKKFCSYVQEVPKNMKLRTEENLTDTISQLQMFNPFFNRNTRIINVCLLKMGRIVFKHSQSELYKAGQELDYFYIILFGKVKIVQRSFRRTCQTGQTILEEFLFSDKSKKVSLQRAKVINSSYLLQMKIDEYKKLKQELIRHGLKLNYQQMQSIIKRNYIIKNWMRNKKRMQTYK